MELNELIKKHLRNVVNEQRSGNYMFFSNLEQIKRQCDLLLKLDQTMVDEIIDNGHDWADDHISSAKENMDQVFDFLMNESKKSSSNPEMDMNEENQLDEKCWDGYKQVGGKKKNGKMVPNCVPTNESSSPAQQAAIAINMKKEGKKPKNESEKEMYEAMEIDESENCPTDPAKWSASKAAAKAKFDVYPSAYANGWAAKNYKSKGGGWKKCK
jgi:hypothetical protein